jgi:hypothetical protein
MIPIQLRIVLLAAVVIYYVIILSLLKHRKLDLKYTLLWLLTGVLMLLLIAFPQITWGIAGLVGMQSGMNVLYLCLLAFIVMILMSLTSIVSGQKERIRKLAENNALLEKRIRELEERLQEPGIETQGK